MAKCSDSYRKPINHKTLNLEAALQAHPRREPSLLTIHDLDG